ncbi:glycosyltransferase family 2 protein [Candidatus Shapirobacteria bacterium]|nr:glycosyltransferase family 2 protein [Candidatus Shapirobacteria bacterium]
MAKPIVSIIILSYNTADITINCLESIYQDKGLKETPFEVIIIDNASTDNSVEKIKKFQNSLKNDNLTLIVNKLNLGFTGGNNQAFKLSEGNYILFLNSDTIILHSAISQTLDWLCSHPEAGICTAQLLNPDKTIQMSGGFFPNLFNTLTWSLGLDDLPFVNRLIPPIHPHTPNFYTHDTFFLHDHRQDWVTGAFMMVRRELIEKTNGFDENYFMYGEELELTYRIKKLFPNLQTWYLVGPQIIHIGRASSPHQKFSFEKENQGMLAFFKKNHSSLLPIVKILIKINQILRSTIYLFFRKDV